MARPYSPEFKYSDRERWICFYPAYINSKKTLAQGRRIPKEKAVEDPTYQELKDVCVAAGLTIGVENKVYPRELYHKDITYRGRIRIHFRDDDGKPLHDKFPTKDSIFLHVAEMIPQLKTRIQKKNQQQASQQNKQSSTAASNKQKGKGGKKKK